MGRIRFVLSWKWALYFDLYCIGPNGRLIGQDSTDSRIDLCKTINIIHQSAKYLHYIQCFFFVLQFKRYLLFESFSWLVVFICLHTSSLPEGAITVSRHLGTLWAARHTAGTVWMCPFVAHVVNPSVFSNSRSCCSCEEKWVWFFFFNYKARKFCSK